MKEMLEERRRALENMFFEKYNRELLEQMRENRQHNVDRDRLSQVCGIEDEEFLDLLLDQNVQAESLAALVLVPLVVVAWADREMNPEEIRVILEAAEESGIEENSSAIKLLNYWLLHPPTGKLIDAWNDYTRVLCDRLDANERKHFGDNLLRWANKVARAEGGVLGIGPKVSKMEREAIARMAAVFEA